MILLVQEPITKTIKSNLQASNMKDKEGVHNKF